MTVAVALVSRLLGVPARADTAMTGSRRGGSWIGLRSVMRVYVTILCALFVCLFVCVLRFLFDLCYKYIWYLVFLFVCACLSERPEASHAAYGCAYVDWAPVREMYMRMLAVT